MNSLRYRLMCVLENIRYMEKYVTIQRPNSRNRELARQLSETDVAQGIYRAPDETRNSTT